MNNLFLLKILLITVYLSSCSSGVFGRVGYGPGEQEWGHINVRQGSNMFYWLFYTQANGVKPADRPTVIWLQGGPGADSTGYGNFAEIGPLHINGSARSNSWAQYANILFIDNPVGTGFSWAQLSYQFATNNTLIGSDMVTFLTEFFNQYPDLMATPLYIFSESYGGKMTVEIAKQLDAAIQSGKIDVDFRGVTLGDPWISPLDSVLTWAPFLLQTGVVDQAGHDEIAEGAALVEKLIGENQWQQATRAWGDLEKTVNVVSSGVDFDNILYKTRAGLNMKSEAPFDRLYRNHVTHDDSTDIDALMNGPVKKALYIDSPFGFGGQSGQVFNALAEDFMKPVVSVVEELLNNTNVKVAVVTGQLDLFVDTPGTVKWVDTLQWFGAPRCATAARKTLNVDGYIEGYTKTVNNLSLYWVNRAGNRIPTDNPAASVAILRRIIGV